MTIVTEHVNDYPLIRFEIRFERKFPILRSLPSWLLTWRQWRLSTWGVSDRCLIYAGGLMSAMQRCFSDLVCQPLVTFYVIDAYLCLAMLHAWTLEYQHMICMRLMVDTLWRQKVNGQLEKTTGPPSQCLAQQGSGGCQRPIAIYAVEIWDCQGSRSGTTVTVHSDFAQW